MDANDLTGIWSGFYSYPGGLRPGVSFVATLIDSGGVLGGTVHEQWSVGSALLFAAAQGSRHGAQVHFVKTYEAGKPHGQPIVYEGMLNGEATEIEGTWRISGNWSGRFVMRCTRAPAEAVVRELEATV